MSSAAKPNPAIGPDLRSELVEFVKRRVLESDVEDIVQTALTEAIQSPGAPTDSEGLRRWIFGIAKNKVADYHRTRGRGREVIDTPDVAGAPTPYEEADLLRWAERNLPEGDANKKTLDWMLREGDGEKLDAIAKSEKLPPPRVRQRVNRLRRHLKENWQREVALLAAVGVIVGALVIYMMRKPQPDVITHDQNVVDPRAEPLRRAALDKCAANDWQACLDGLDDAKRLDPAGDTQPVVQKARDAATESLKTLKNAPQPGPSSSIVTPPPVAPAPSSSAIQTKTRAPTKAMGTEDFSSPPPPAPTATVPPARKPAPKKAAKPASNSGSSIDPDSTSK